MAREPKDSKLWNRQFNSGIDKHRIRKNPKKTHTHTGRKYLIIATVLFL
jgi:hypothetical protein